MTAALQDLMSVYYSFNITYPTNLPVLLFLQHHVFEIRDNQPVPNIVYSAMCGCNYHMLLVV